MNEPQVSVIITNYNRADLLAEALQSVVDQTWQDFEILVADDGSRDNSLEVIEAFRKDHPHRIRLLTHSGHANRGIVPTYQLAISSARGEYVAFLEHDDRWTPTFLAAKVAIMQSHPEVGVVFSPYRVNGTGWFGRDMILRQFLLRMTIRTGRPFDNYRNLLQSNNIATFSCFMTRRGLLETLPPPPGTILAFDWWILVHLSIGSLFYCDRSSRTLWRWSKQSAIGRQTFETHRTQGCAFMALMYERIGQERDRLPAEKREVFEKSREQFAYFIAFYTQPGLRRFTQFFRRAPVWALASAVSLVINHMKFD